MYIYTSKVKLLALTDVIRPHHYDDKSEGQQVVTLGKLVDKSLEGHPPMDVKPEPWEE